MVTLENGSLTVKISPLGAQLKSMVCDGWEYIYPSQPEVWPKSAPNLFPITGGLKEDTYTHNGKSYRMEKHGFAQQSVFTVESCERDRAVFLLCDDEHAFAQYPFHFEFRIVYELCGRTLRVTYRVRNRSHEQMYFSVGAHEGYYTPEGIEDYDVIFDRDLTLDTTRLYGNLVAKAKARLLTDGRVLPMYEKFFAIDALVFEDIESKSLRLRNRKNGRTVQIDYPFAPHLLLWHTPNAPFLCVEPWAGLPDREGSGYELSKKEGMISLAPDAEYSGVHSISV